MRRGRARTFRRSQNDEREITGCSAHYLGNRFLSIFIRLTLHHLCISVKMEGTKTQKSCALRIRSEISLDSILRSFLPGARNNTECISKMRYRDEREREGGITSILICAIIALSAGAVVSRPTIVAAVCVPHRNVMLRKIKV